MNTVGHYNMKPERQFKLRTSSRLTDTAVDGPWIIKEAKQSRLQLN